MASTKQIKGEVSGIVQGVGFRYFVRETAELLGLHGYVRNLPNSRVEFVFSGSDVQIAQALERVKVGPTYAKVDSLHYEDLAVAEGECFSDFTIRY